MSKFTVVHEGGCNHSMMFWSVVVVFLNAFRCRCFVLAWISMPMLFSCTRQSGTSKWTNKTPLCMLKTLWEHLHLEKGWKKVSIWTQHLDEIPLFNEFPAVVQYVWMGFPGRGLCTKCLVSASIFIYIFNVNCLFSLILQQAVNVTCMADTKETF